MIYYFSKRINTSFEEAIEKVTAILASNGFGIITEIDVTSTFKKKLDIDFRKYRILGACSPKHAYAAISNEDKIGLMLPCNVVVQELSDNLIEVSAIDPIASMASVENNNLGEIAQEIQSKLKLVIESL
jgi:uncharacterized protein (DUF302 family)